MVMEVRKMVTSGIVIKSEKGEKDFTPSKPILAEPISLYEGLRFEVLSRAMIQSFYLTEDGKKRVLLNNGKDLKVGDFVYRGKSTRLLEVHGYSDSDDGAIHILPPGIEPYSTKPRDKAVIPLAWKIRLENSCYNNLKDVKLTKDRETITSNKETRPTYYQDVERGFGPRPRFSVPRVNPICCYA
jgi:hypothetical protein